MSTTTMRIFALSHICSLATAHQSLMDRHCYPILFSISPYITEKRGRIVSWLAFESLSFNLFDIFGRRTCRLANVPAHLDHVDRRVTLDGTIEIDDNGFLYWRLRVDRVERETHTNTHTHSWGNEMLKAGRKNNKVWPEKRIVIMMIIRIITKKELPNRLERKSKTSNKKDVDLLFLYSSSLLKRNIFSCFLNKTTTWWASSW